MQRQPRVHSVDRYHPQNTNNRNLKIKTLLPDGLASKVNPSLSAKRLVFVPGFNRSICKLVNILIFPTCSTKMSDWVKNLAQYLAQIWLKFNAIV